MADLKQTLNSKIESNNTAIIIAYYNPQGEKVTNCINRI